MEHKQLIADRGNLEMHPDPVTGEPGAHPVGAGVGAAVGGTVGIGSAIAAGALAGSVAGPVGTAVGVVVGAVAGGLIGKGVAEGIEPSRHHAYWRANYKTQPYVLDGATYEQYAPAYQHGWESRAAFGGKSFEDAEEHLGRSWDDRRGESTLSWEEAKPAVKDGWVRATEMGPWD